MITIKKSKTADTRSCDYKSVSKETLKKSSLQHIDDINKGMQFFSDMISYAGCEHDSDKLDDLDGFHHDFLTGFKKTTWWDKHRRINRHHLLQDDGVPEDVNLVDVIEMIVDCVMAGMGRTGEIYPLEINDKVLRDAFNNTAKLLKEQILVKD